MQVAAGYIQDIHLCSILNLGENQYFLLSN
jgi:hypothetical protein